MSVDRQHSTVNPSVNWEGRLTIIAFLVGVVIFDKMKGAAQFNEALRFGFWSVLGLSTLLGLVSAVRHRRGWVYLLLPGLTWLFIGFLAAFGPFH